MSVTLTPIATASVPPPIDVTTLTRVKTILQLGSETKYDTFLADAIKAISKRFEQYMARGITQGSRTEYFDVFEGRRVFGLVGYPVASVSSVRNDDLHAFPASTELSTDVYTPSTVNQSTSQDGLLFVDRTELVPGPRSLKVVYVGGMAPDASTFISYFPDLAEAADLQVAFIHKRRNTLPLAGVSVEGSSVTADPWELLPEVKDRLDRYRRMGGV